MLQSKIHRRKSLTAGRLFFADEICSSSEATRQCVVAEHKTSHVRFTNWRLGLSVPLQLDEVRNFVQRKFGWRTYFTPCFSPFLPSLSYLSLIFVHPLHANVHRWGCAQQTFPLISWSRYIAATFGFWGEKEKTPVEIKTATSRWITYPAIYSQNLVLFPFATEFQISDVPRISTCRFPLKFTILT